MKQIFITFFLVLAVIFCNSQINFTGSYGYILKQGDFKTGNEKKVTPGGTLVLIKMDGNKYRFWLDVLTGPPAYNRGETDGTISFKNDTASFDNTFEDATSDCFLHFKITGKTIEINSGSFSFNCGFGNDVQADGHYTWIEKQEPLNNDWLKKQYPQAEFVKIAASGAELYQDEDGLRSFSKKQFLEKGEKVLNVSETEKTIYTEMIRPDGTLRYGWVRKSLIVISE